MTHGLQEILRLFQGNKHFLRSQRLRLETPVWRVLDFEGNPMREEESGWQRERFLRSKHLVRDREYPFSEYLIVDSSGAVDVSLPMLVKVSALIESLHLDRFYKLARQLWTQFTLVAGRLNVDVTRSRGEVLVSALLAS